MYFVQETGGLPLVGAVQALKTDQLNRKIDCIIAAVKAGRDVAEVMQEMVTDMDTAEQQTMVMLIVRRLREIPEEDPETYIRETNTVLLNSLPYLYTVGMEMFRKLEKYAYRVHQIPGIKNEKQELVANWAKEHLLLNGRVIRECNLKDYHTNEGHGTHSGAKRLKHL